MADAAAPVAEPPADGGRDWSELPLDALALIFTKVGAFDVLKGAGFVCRSWLDAAKVPDVWRTLDFKTYWGDFSAVIHTMAKVAVYRSGGQLEVFTGFLRFDDEFLEYMVERSPSLMVLDLGCCNCEFTGIVRRKLPLPELRKLHLDYMWYLTAKTLSAVLDNFPRLDLLVVNNCFYISEKDDVQALAAKCAASGVTFDWDGLFDDEDEEDYSSDDVQLMAS